MSSFLAYYSASPRPTPSSSLLLAGLLTLLPHSAIYKPLQGISQNHQVHHESHTVLLPPLSLRIALTYSEWWEHTLALNSGPSRILFLSTFLTRCPVMPTDPCCNCLNSRLWATFSTIYSPLKIPPVYFKLKSNSFPLQKEISLTIPSHSSGIYLFV